ncbi:MAG TPA: formate dehydrogenase subunit gamma [Methylomirabilota bacterium]|nr:formate dehydrogenase subunit gamma [Methylomirabilota bacterium]
MTARHSGNGHAAPIRDSIAIAKIVDEIVARVGDRPDALMPLLHAVQERLGYIPVDAVPEIARALNLSRAEVHGVISFYHDFRTTRAGRSIIRVCRAESCQAMGAVELASHIQKRLGLEFGQTSADGEYTLEPVYCLGNCACSPAIVVGADIHGRVTPERFDEIFSAIPPRSRDAS